MHIILIIIVIVAFAALIYGPSIWVNRVMKKYKTPDDLFPGSGGELAVHLLEKLDIHNVIVEQTEPNQDHYDPLTRAVRLSPDNYKGKSLTAITVAAHEVGHAIQHATNYPMFGFRHKLVHIAHFAEKLGSAAIIAMPVFALVTRSPAVGGAILLVGVGSIAIGTLVHLVTLPVEWDASFKRALPVLSAGEYISESQLVHAHKILKAAALTYVAGSLASLLNLYRWIAILRR